MKTLSRERYYFLIIFFSILPRTENKKLDISKIYVFACDKGIAFLKTGQGNLLLFQWRPAKFKEITSKNILVQVQVASTEKIYYYFRTNMNLLAEIIGIIIGVEALF